ncbi:LysR family transcriptional regulator [Fluviibacterium sp. DFM31]|uniref:LysR family transcriptional regulator n=1 Tax=Meridianimarinicoccus marinus TaxID=3231483 RepID=A0ABV3L2U3_9RHOB
MKDPLANFDWTRARAFLATAEEGSLSAAARKLGLTQPTLGRQVAALEEELGVLLFERVGKSLTLTRAGADLLEPVRAMGAAATRVALAASGQAQSIDGLVRITASDIFSAYHLVPVLGELRRQAPMLEIDIVAVNDIRDLMRREADIAIRHVRPTQPDLIARLLGEASASLYAAPDYLRARGQPQTVEDLKGHDFISFGDPDVMRDHLQALGYPVARASFKLNSQNGLVAWECVRRGLGIVMMSDAVGQASGMVRLLPQVEPLRFPVWLTTHREIHTSRRIRLVFDLLARHLEIA